MELHNRDINPAVSPKRVNATLGPPPATKANRRSFAVRPATADKIAAIYVLVRIVVVLSVYPAIATADTGGYRMAVGNRPLLGRTLIDILPPEVFSGVTTFLLSCAFGWLGAIVLRRESTSSTIAAAGIAFASLSPSMIFYERSILPDGLLFAALVAAAALFAMTRLRGRSLLLAVLVVSIVALLSKETAVLVLPALSSVLIWRGKVAAAAMATLLASAALVFVNLPMANVAGPVVTGNAEPTTATMHRFRVAPHVLDQPSMNSETKSAHAEAVACGISQQRMALEILGASDVRVFDECPQFWAGVDRISVVTLVAAHVHSPNSRTRSMLLSGFAPKLSAEFELTGYPAKSLLLFDQTLHVALSLGALIVAGWALVKRERRWLGIGILVAFACATVTILSDPSAVDRHSAPLRLTAWVLAGVAVSFRRPQPDIENQVAGDNSL